MGIARQGQGEAKNGDSTAASFSSFFCCFLPSTSARADLPLTIACTLTAELSSTRFCSASCTTDFGGGDFPLAPQIAFFFSEDFLTGLRLASSELVTPELFRLNDDASRNMLRARRRFIGPKPGRYSHTTIDSLMPQLFVGRVSSYVAPTNYLLPYFYTFTWHRRKTARLPTFIYLETKSCLGTSLVSGAHTVARAGRGRG